MKTITFIIILVSGIMFACSENNSSSICNNIDCGEFGHCVNDSGAPACLCDSGYHSTVLKCISDDIDYCKNIKCQDNASCSKDSGVCECNNGYKLNGKSCIKDNNIDLCKDKTCQINSSCNSNTGNCDCNEGYHLDGKNCSINETIKADIYIGPTREYKTAKDAQTAIQDGFIIQIDEGTYDDVTTWTSNNITIRGEGKVIYDLKGKNISNRKAIWVIQGNNITIENIEFIGAAVGDRNGAGVRYEGNGKLTVKNCYFHHNEDGILTGNKGTEDITIIGCEFHDHGKSNGGFSHNIYIGEGAKFTMINSYSHDAYEGHDVKTRADENYILYNRIVDHNDWNTDKASSYLIDLPEGGLSFIIGNEFHQSIKASNPAAISYAKENLKGPIQRLYMINNTFVNSKTNNSTLINFGGNPEINIQNNIINNFTNISNGSYTGILDNNENNPTFIDKDNMNYELKADSSGVNMGITLSTEDSMNLIPISEYSHPKTLINRIIKDKIDIGAHELK